jgi:TolA-binding protein
MAEDVADRQGYGEGMKEFHGHAIAYLLPPSEAAAEWLRRRWEKGKGRRDFERYLVLLTRLGWKKEARRLLDRQLEDDRAEGIENSQLVLLGALLWPEDMDQFSGSLRRVFAADGPTCARVAALQLLMRRLGGKELATLLAALPKPADQKLETAVRLARLELALCNEDWSSAKSLAEAFFRETNLDSGKREKFLRLWLWLALERMPADYGEIATLLRHSDSGGTVRRTIHLALAAHYLRQGNCSLARRFLEECGPLNPEEFILRIRIDFANGQFSPPWELLRNAWNSDQPPSEELLLEANAFYANSTLAHQWTRWLTEILTKEPLLHPTARLTGSRLAALRNAINLSDLELAERLSRSLLAFSDEFSLSREESAKLQLLLVQLAMAHGDKQRVSDDLKLLRENFPDGSEAMNSYFLAGGHFENRGDGEAAFAELCAFLDRYPGSDRSSEALFRMARLLAEQGDGVGAIALLETLIQNHRRSAYGRLGQLLSGDLLRERQEWEAAEAAYRSLLGENQLDDVVPFARLGLAKCLLASPSAAARREALECLEWLSADSATDADFSLEVAYVLALALRREGDGAHARQVLQKGVQKYCEGQNAFLFPPKGKFWLSAAESLLRDCE